jgi:hypothetical protein
MQFSDDRDEYNRRGADLGTALLRQGLHSLCANPILAREAWRLR